METGRHQGERGSGMIKFSLKRLLEHAPYEIVLSGNDFLFRTDFGIHYSISFNKEDIVLGGCDTYQFIIRKIEEAKSSHDSKVEATILAIVNEFFQSNHEILLYLCDTSDGREVPRNRLFLSWFDRYKNRFTICQAHAKVEDEDLYLCIVIDNRHPKLQEIKLDFESKAALLTEGKP